MILISGCSWSNPNFKTDYHPEMKHDYPKWYDYIQTDEEVVSIGVSGQSNHSIIDRALQQVLVNPDITQVVVALTEWARFNFMKQEIHPNLLALKDWIATKKRKTKREELMVEHIESWIQHHNKFIKLDDLKPRHYIPYTVEQILLKIKTLQEICKAKGIKLQVFQMIWPLHDQGDAAEIGLDVIIKNELFQQMYTESNDNFLNFPFFRSLGGNCVESLLKSRDDYNELVISEVDHHPNGNGHMWIGEWFNEQVGLH